MAMVFNVIYINEPFAMLRRTVSSLPYVELRQFANYQILLAKHWHIKAKQFQTLLDMSEDGWHVALALTLSKLLSFRISLTFYTV